MHRCQGADFEVLLNFGEKQMPPGQQGQRWQLEDCHLFTAGCTAPLRELLDYDVVGRDTLAANVTRWTAQQEHKSTLLEVCRALGVQPKTAPGLTEDRSIAQEILQAFQAGELFLLRVRSGSTTSKEGERAAAAAAAAAKRNSAPPPAPVKQKTWIEVLVVDEDDRPLTGRSYDLLDTEGVHR